MLFVLYFLIFLYSPSLCSYSDYGDYLLHRFEDPDFYYYDTCFDGNALDTVENISPLPSPDSISSLSVIATSTTAQPSNIPPLIGHFVLKENGEPLVSFGFYKFILSTIIVRAIKGLDPQFKLENKIIFLLPVDIHTNVHFQRAQKVRFFKTETKIVHSKVEDRYYTIDDIYPFQSNIPSRALRRIP